MRSNRERMKSAAARFSSVSVSRPRSESPARKKRSARRSSCRMESFCGARCCAASETPAATHAATRSDGFMPVIMHRTEGTAENAKTAETAPRIRPIFDDPKEPRSTQRPRRRRGAHDGVYYDRGTRRNRGGRKESPSRRGERFTTKITKDTKSTKDRNPRNGHDGVRPGPRCGPQTEHAPQNAKPSAIGVSRFVTRVSFSRGRLA